MPLQIEGEFPEILGIRESLIKHVFEPAALQVSLARYADSDDAAFVMSLHPHSFRDTLLWHIKPMLHCMSQAVG